jgi:hypothetical protein
MNRRCGRSKIGNALRRHRAAGQDEAHRLVDAPVGRREAAGRHDLQIAAGRVGRRRHEYRGQFLAAVLVAQQPGHEADRARAAVRKLDQHDALRAFGLGLQDVEQLARAAVDGIGQRHARDAAFDAADQALSDHAMREHADRDDRDQGRDQRDAGLDPRIVEPAQRAGIGIGEPLRQRADPGMAQARQQAEDEGEHDPGQPDRQQGQQP